MADDINVGAITEVLNDKADKITVDEQFERTVNYGNITNCITEIPQDIKLELADGTLTLKAGSKIHLAYGDLETTATTTSDVSATQTNAGQYVVMRSSKTALYLANIETCLSGTIANRPTLLERGAGLYFATDENKMYLTGDKGANWYSGEAYSLPLGIVTVSNGAISSIDQIFNGFGYIGSTIFALPGVKGLAPNGRNADGSLKNTEFTTGSVLTQTLTSGTFDARPVILRANVLGFNANASYDNKTNTLSTGNYMIVGTGSAVGGKITSFETKTAFHAVDYSDLQPTTNSGLLSNILSAIYPIGSVYITTADTNPMATLIKGSSWTLVAKGRALWGGNGTSGSGTTANDQYNNAPANTTIAAGLPNITGSFGRVASVNNTVSNAFASGTTERHGNGGDDLSYYDYSFDASRSSTVYRNDVTTVQPPAYVVNVWRRTA